MTAISSVDRLQFHMSDMISLVLATNISIDEHFRTARF